MLTQPATTASITTHGLTVTGIAANNKVYDGTNAATLNLSGATMVGVASGDTVTLETGSATATFADANVGTAKAVTVSGLTLSGDDAANYALVQPSTTADITAATVTASVTVDNKIYDGTTTASIATRTISGVIGDENVSLNGGTATFADENVGTAKSVTVTGLSLSGDDAGNYQLASTSATTTADITPRPLTVSATGLNKVYDSTTMAAVTLADNRVSGDDVTASYTAASFADANVGTGKTIAVSGILVTGTDADNYSVNTTAIATADITLATLTAGVTADNKIYDGTTAAALATGILNGVMASDDVSLVGGTAAFADKNAGTGKTVTATGLSLSGADAANYQLASSSAATSADIAARTLTVSATGENKVYDGTTAATVTLLDDRIENDVLTVSYTTASFADNNVQNGKLVSVSGISVSGTDAGNYTANTEASTVADITGATLTVVGITAQNKVYDGTTVATLNLDGAVTIGVVSGDDVTVDASGVAGAFSDAEVGTGKLVTVSGLTLTGADAGKYTLTQPTTTADITAQ
jgi:hypothetical protein